MKISIVYTSDVHGQLTSRHYPSNQPKDFGLVRLPSYLKSMDHPTLLLDNGDVLQGSVMLDYARENPTYDFPVADIMNQCGYQGMTLGNHDFNYGQPFLKAFTEKLTFPVLCANLVDDDHQPIFQTHHIYVIDGITIGVIGLITQYVPVWEKPTHITNMHFKDPVETAKPLIKKIRPHVDVCVVLYHGGFEKDLETAQPIGRPTLENQAVALSEIPGIDCLLTGHQHLPTVFHSNDTVILQPPAHATHVGRVELTFDEQQLIKKEGFLDPLDGAEDETLLRTLAPLEKVVQSWLDEPIATSDEPYLITDPFEARLNTHPLFHYVNDLQIKHTGAMISATALPNDAPGFGKVITMRDIAANFVYPNTLVVLEVTGQILLDALFQTSQYFTLKDNQIRINPDFIHPKVEHYNYDVYGPIRYTIDLTKNTHSRINAIYQGKPIDPSKTYTLVLPSYRAASGGDYLMFKEAKVLKEYDMTIFTLILNALKKTEKFPLIARKNPIFYTKK